MKQLLVFIRKEFYHVFRDRRTLLILFGLPTAQILLFGFALSSEVKDVNLAVVDFAKDNASQQIISRLQASTRFRLQRSPLSYSEMETAFRRNTIKAALVIPANFNRDLLHTGRGQLQIIADASDPNAATTITNYLTAIVGDYQQELNQAAGALPYQIMPETRMLYNPDMNGSLNFIPGVLALVLMIVCTTLTSVAIVREKELGTMEILLVSPFRPLLVLIAKAVPYLVLSLLDFTLILLLSVFVLNVAIQGSVVLLYVVSTVFIISCLSLGLLISNVTASQQVAMLASMMGMMLPTLLFTGFMFPLENLPGPLRLVPNIVPSHWYYLVVKAIMLKGLGFEAVWKETLILGLMAVVLLGISLRNFKIRLT
ncbi:ABC transporter permease [Hymenobacter sp. BT491]|uniref:ABC transporter permease n=1 Tax=Hymenobacter sp. BT491 TaxID=2766779 RepID=UPI001653958E|nr:ABC transporter permease [Hymenobacter sp. BT491]MBC6988747.1 ABC transporter permease [Hymenobacter sp. BT491]